MKSIILFTAIAASTTNVNANNEYYCTYLGGVIEKGSDYTTGQGFGNQQCHAGDVLKIVTYDKMNAGRESMYLTDIIIELCNINHPVTVIGPIGKGNDASGSMNALCTYLGKRKLPRK